MPSRDEHQQILQMKVELDAVRVEWKTAMREYFTRKFNKLQPRRPHGPGGGRWMRLGDAPLGLVIQAGQSAAYCWNQMLIDNLLCNSVKVNWRRAACRAQANERYAACLAGRPLPPLSY